MSILSYICDYGSESDDGSDCEIKQKRSKLPIPDLSKVAVVSFDTHLDDPEQHDGRTRSFPHVRGNWATFVYIKYTAEDCLSILIDKLEKRLLTYDKLWKKCDNVHISVSKTVVLNYHLITPFTGSLQKTISELDSFELGFSGLKIYCNEENTRTFIALQTDFFSHKYLLILTEKIDEILKNFNLPTFYENPSFHMSLFWVNGNHISEATNIVKELEDIVNSEIEKSLRTVLIESVFCKSGNKQFQYHFQ